MSPPPKAGAPAQAPYAPRPPHLVGAPPPAPLAPSAPAPWPPGLGGALHLDGGPAGRLEHKGPHPDRGGPVPPNANALPERRTGRRRGRQGLALQCVSFEPCRPWPSTPSWPLIVAASGGGRCPARARVLGRGARSAQRRRGGGSQRVRRAPEVRVEVARDPGVHPRLEKN